MGLGSSGMALAGGGGGKGRGGSPSGLGLCCGCCAGCVWQLGEMLLPFPQPWIRGWDEPLAPSRCSWSDSLARAGLIHRDFPAPRMIKAHKRCHSRVLAEHPIPWGSLSSDPNPSNPSLALFHNL